MVRHWPSAIARGNPFERACADNRRNGLFSSPYALFLVSRPPPKAVARPYSPIKKYAPPCF